MKKQFTIQRVPAAGRAAVLVLTAALLSGAPATVSTAAAAGEYEVGGPLAGENLPPYPTQHGEAPGQPGVIPGKYSNQGQTSERELYPGSVEHYRTVQGKYTPTRSIFDRQSQLKNWTAPNLPGANAARAEAYAEPVYWVGRFAEVEFTGFKNQPVPVVRCKVKTPVLSLDLGERNYGLYAVRVIGAVETARLRPWREPLFLTLRINDGLRGETNSYRQRVGYVDEFYSVAEIYFHAPEKRHYQAELFVDEGSTVDLLVHNVTLDDALPGVIHQPIKTRRTWYTDDDLAGIKTTFDAGQAKTIAKLQPLSPEERLARDEMVWKWLPPINSQGVASGLPGPDWEPGVAEQTGAEIEAAYGKWEVVWDRPRLFDYGAGTLDFDTKLYGMFMVNKKLGLQYTMDDLIAHKPLPDPYPYKDPGAGLYFPDPKNPGKGRLWTPIADAVSQRQRGRSFLGVSTARAWVATGNPDLARDAAVALVRYAYDLPTMDIANSIGSVYRQPGAFTLDQRCRKRMATAYWMDHYANYMPELYGYDLLFDYVKGNEALAASIHRFVPWVKTSQDVIELLDSYLVQGTAQRIMRYHYSTASTAIVDAAAILGDTRVTDDWMRWAFARSFQPPLPLAGLQDAMITGTDRSGSYAVGSSYYAAGDKPFTEAALAVSRYIASGGNRQFDLSDPARFPKALAHCYWHLDMLVGGPYVARIGDVAGPGLRPGQSIDPVVHPEVAAHLRAGWLWSGDPKFAWVLRYLLGRKNETDDQWKKIEVAAAKLPRAPWLENRSRFLPNWFAALETGQSHDDYRFRRAVYVRTGVGYGHAHDDALDLQVVAHGLHLTIDGGQRSGYSKPNDRFTRIHNTVEIDGKSAQAYAWPRSVSDAPGARVMDIQTAPPAGAALYRRQVALIDVDEGQGSTPLPQPEQQLPDAPLPKGVATANSYVFDVFRVAGGKLHTYCFHGTVNDDFQWNAVNPGKVAQVPATASVSNDADYLSIFENTPESKLAGDVPADGTLEATFRQVRFEKDTKGGGSEESLLRKNFDPESPRKFTRWHLLDAAGDRALKADVDMHKAGYRWTAAMLQHRLNREHPESVFVAVIEPYAGEPFLRSLRSLPVSDAGDGALRAVAIEVKTKNGHTDVCFADGNPTRTREFEISNFKFQIAGEFAYHSADTQGLRQATISGGTLLQGPDVRLAPAAAQRVARVVAVDYLHKTITLDQPWPDAQPGRVIEIGQPGSGRMTAYTVTAVQAGGKGAVLTVQRGADFYRSPIQTVDAAAGKVRCALSFSWQGPGVLQNWVASNDDGSKVWRADVAGDREFVLRGAPVGPADFGSANVLRLWEYGVDDTVRLASFASLRRMGNETFELTGNTDVDVTIANGPPHRVTLAEFAAQGGAVSLTREGNIIRPDARTK